MIFGMKTYLPSWHGITMLGFWGIFQQNPPSIPKCRVNFQKHQHLVTWFFFALLFFPAKKNHGVFFPKVFLQFSFGISQVCLHRTTPRLSKCLGLWLHPCGAWCHHWTLRPWRCQAERLEVTASHAATQAEELPAVSGGNRFSWWLMMTIYYIVNLGEFQDVL